MTANKEKRLKNTAHVDLCRIDGFGKSACAFFISAMSEIPVMYNSWIAGDHHSDRTVVWNIVKTKGGALCV